MGFGTSLLYDSDNTFTIGSNLILRNDKKLNFEIGLATSLLVNYNAGLDDEERRIMAEGGSWYCHPLLTLFSTFFLWFFADVSSCSDLLHNKYVFLFFCFPGTE